MINIKQESILIKKLKSLTELELVSVFEELADHISKNRLSEAVQQALDIEDLRKDVASLENDVEELEDDKKDLENKIDDAREILEGIETLDDDAQKEIDKAISELDI